MESNKIGDKVLGVKEGTCKSCPFKEENKKLGEGYQLCHKDSFDKEKPLFECKNSKVI